MKISYLGLEHFSSCLYLCIKAHWVPHLGHQFFCQRLDLKKKIQATWDPSNEVKIQDYDKFQEIYTDLPSDKTNSRVGSDLVDVKRFENIIYDLKRS